MKRIVCFFFALSFVLGAYSQEDTPIPSINSPYSMYGYGKMTDLSFARGRAMGGVGYGFREGTEINISNPASYSAVDSMTFIFDAGMSFQNTNLNDGVNKANAKNAAFDYVAVQFRLCKRLGLTAGYVPYSNVGYNFSSNAYMDPDDLEGDYSTNKYTGNGNLQQVLLGLGANPFGGFSLGANISYLYGQINRTVMSTLSDASAYVFSKHKTLSIRDYRFDAGIQYAFDFADSKHQFVIGAVYSLGHTMNSDSYLQDLKTSSNTVVSVRSDTLKGACDFPQIFGGGVNYCFDDKLVFAFDYTLEQWSKCKYVGEDNLFFDRSKYAFGAEYTPNKRGKNFFGRVKYRVGAYYYTPYLNIDNGKSAREFGISAGAAFPMFGNRSLAHVSFQYSKVNSSNANMLDESYFKLSVGLTFNERWFAKIKVR